MRHIAAILPHGFSEENPEVEHAKTIDSVMSGKDFFSFSIDIPKEKISFEIMDSVSSEKQEKGTRVIIRGSRHV